MRTIHQTAIRSAVAAAILVLAALDAISPLGVNVPILYLLPLLVTFFSERIRLRIVVTLAVSLLTAAGMASPVKWSGDWDAGLVNRCFDLGVFWVALALSVRDSRNTRELQDLRRALDTASVVSIMDPSGVLRHVNDGFCALTGYSRKELTGRDHGFLNVDPAASVHTRDLWSTIAAGAIWHGEIPWRAKSGALYWVDTTIVPFLTDSGVPYQYLSIHHDVTDRKHTELRLRNEAAFAKIGEMVALVAHEVRNPLAAVRGGLELFGFRSSLSSADVEMTRHMVERLDLLEAHVKALLHYAQPRTPRLQPVAVRPLVDRIARSVLDDDAHGDIRCQIAGTDALVLADPVMLEEVFSHLLRNAVEAHPGAGRIEIAVGTDDVATVAIADAGRGIPPQLHERVFEPFFTTKSGGAGLGLPIARQLLELHGGDIAIATSSPSGTTMQVSLPLTIGSGAAQRVNSSRV